MADGMNQRTRLTLQLIREAFLRLLKRGGFESATVTAICKEAQINRTTFYRYYDNQYQLLEELEEELISEMEAHGSDYLLVDGTPESMEKARKTLVDFFECIDSRIELYRVLTEHVHPNIFEKSRILRMNATIDALSERIGVSRANYVANFTIAGGQSVVASWISKDRDRESPEEISDVLLDLVASAFVE